MMVSIYTFSGTGNTFLTAGNIARCLNDMGITVEQFNIENYPLKAISDDSDHILIGYPIHAFNAPRIVVEFVRKFPESKGKKFSIFKVSGEPFSINDGSSHLILKTLKAKGYRYTTEFHFLMPYNIMFRYPPAVAKQMYLHMIEKAKEFSYNIANEIENPIAYTYLNRIISFVFRIQWPGARLNGYLYSCNRKRCTLCMKCVDNCPACNISVSGNKIQFDGNCMMCMRCVQNCGSDAINIGILRFWAIRGAYDYKMLAKDASIASDYITNTAKGYFRLFRKHFEK